MMRVVKILGADCNMCCRMCIRLCIPLHTLALPAFPLRSLGHGPIHIAVAAPTTIAITTPSPSPLQLLALRYHPATYPACAAATMCHQRFQGCRNTSQHHTEGFGQCPALWRGAERVCSPLLGSKAPSSSVVYFFYCYILVLLNTNTIIYILCIKQGRVGASALAVRDDKLSCARQWAHVILSC